MARSSRSLYSALSGALATARAYCSAAKSHCSALSYFAPSLKFFLPDLPPPKTVTGRLKQIVRRNTSDVRRPEYFFIATSDRHLDTLRPGVISITSKKIGDACV